MLRLISQVSAEPAVMIRIFTDIQRWESQALKMKDEGLITGNIEISSAYDRRYLPGVNCECNGM